MHEDQEGRPRRGAHRQGPGQGGRRSCAPSPSEGKVIVEGVNIAKKHQQATRATMQGGIIDKDMPIPVSNVAIICPSDGRPTRVGYRFDADGNKVRICRKCGGEL